MSIEQQLTSMLTAAMREKRTRDLDILRMIKSQAALAKTAPGFDGKEDDRFWQQVIILYAKQQKRAIEEFRKAGEQGVGQVEQLKYELEFLAPFLPGQKSEKEVRALVRQAIAESGAVGTKMAGRIVGIVVKQHRDEVDPATAKRIAEEELG